MRTPAKNRGFTLVELVLVIVIVGVLAGMSARLISQPVEMFDEQARRAELTDAAASALMLMARDIRNALPNSLRLSGGNALELLRVVDAERYRTDPPGGAADRLRFNAADDQFNTLGALGDAASYTNHYLSVYPLGQAGANPWLDDVLSPPVNVTVASVTAPGPPGYDDEYRVTLSAAHQFPFESPAQRIFLVEGPVSYLCAGGRLERFQGYGVMAAQPTTAAATGVAGALVVRDVESCSFSYTAAGARRGLLTLALALNSAGERVRLLRQVHVDNTP